MGIFKALTDAVGGTLADQWKDIITPAPFAERTVLAPGLLQGSNAGRGSNYLGSDGVITAGSKILVPESTAAVVFSQGGIEAIITQPGGYEYEDGQVSVFDGDGITEAIVDQAMERVTFGGQTPDQKRIAFVNLREIRGLKFGTRGPLVYHDLFYGTDLEILAFGSFAVQVVDATKFVRSYAPPNVLSYSFDSPQARAQILPEFLQSLIDALNTLSTQYRISQLPSQVEEVAARIASDSSNAGTWAERFGFKIVAIALENIELTPASRELVNQFSANRMSLSAYDGITQDASNVAAQQKIAEGVRDHGLGDAAGLVVGVGFAQGMNPQTAAPSAPTPTPTPPTTPTPTPTMSYEDQIETVKKLKELLDAGALTQEEFEFKKREVMGLG